VARVIAETGLLFVQIGFPYWRPWVELLTPPLNIRTTAKTFFYHGLFSMVIGHDVRETLSVFSTHAIRVADETVTSEESAPRRRFMFSPGFRFMLSLGFALALAYVVSGAAMLYVEYNHAVSLDQTHIYPINIWAVDAGVKSYAFYPTNNYLPPNHGQPEVHSRSGHFAFGFGVVTLLSILRFRFAWWPLHPVGLLTAYGWPMKCIWFSIFVGWLLKVIIVRFGGMDLFRAARNFFIGLIIGEAGAAGFWLIVTLVLNAKGVSYKPIRLFPN